MKSSQGVLFLGGHPTKLMAYAVEELLTWYPFLPVEKTLQVWAQHHCTRDIFWHYSKVNSPAKAAYWKHDMRFEQVCVSLTRRRGIQRGLFLPSGAFKRVLQISDVCICCIQVNITGYWDLYNRVLSDKTSLTKAGAMPSSGLLGMPPSALLTQKTQWYPDIILTPAPD